MSRARQQRRKLQRLATVSEASQDGEQQGVYEQSGLKLTTETQDLIQYSYKLHYSKGDRQGASIVLMAAQWQEIVSRLGGENEVVKQVMGDIGLYTRLLQMLPPGTMQKVTQAQAPAGKPAVKPSGLVIVKR